MESESKDVVDLLSVPNNLTDISVLLSNEDSIPTDLGKKQLSEFYEGTISNLEVNLTDVTEDEKLLNDSNKTPVAEASSFVSTSIDSDAMLSLDKFENENAAKDATIATLKELNSELLDEIKFLREPQRESTRVSSDMNELPGATTYDKDEFNQISGINSIFNRTKLMSYSRKMKILKIKFFNYLKTHILKSDYPLPFH